MDGCPYRKAERLYEHAPAIRSLQLAPDGIVTYVYPLEGNENAFGSLFDHPERRAEAEYARDTGKMTLSGPYGLSQGGLGLVARKPIYLDNEGREHTFWGQRGRSECTGNL
ncbi:CHASE domain-containing protein [[Clostridium] symbiosum]|nr:CHASE domain-containing protein [[Clostridium] symbiosum]MDB2010708.1 CHASE domain-containing protein [[Clostridium] symbiosum]MDB2023337.1 CHASE domain-containing protein [[Clostridium] symbiosum]MDB2028196.1 CHASE domain-containing protein [[Clostridium] symbiosum]